MTLAAATLFELHGIDAYELDRAAVAVGGFAEFARLAWPVIEPIALIWEPHLDQLCAHYEAVSRRECLDLVVNIPPGGSKSVFTNVLWPAWVWGPFGQPWHKWIFTSYSGKLTQRDADRCAALVQSEWYQRRWGFLADRKRLDAWGLVPVALAGKDRKPIRGRVSASHYYTTGGGMRFSTMFGGPVTGQHAHTLVADDPVKPQDIQAGGDKAAKALEKVTYRWRNVFGNRTADAATFAKVVIMQRLHELDVAGDCIRAGYTVLRLPMEYDPATHCSTPYGGDWRTVTGELLAPKRFPRAVIDMLKSSVKGVSLRDWHSQYQQAPNPEQGSIFLRGYFVKRWKSVLPSGIKLLQTWDLAFKDQSDSDPVSGLIMGIKGSDLYVVDRRYGVAGLGVCCQWIRDWKKAWSMAHQVAIEDKANGPAVEQTLRGEVGGITMVSPKGGKVARANAVEPYCRAGNVYFADEPWANEVIEALVKFPTGANDHDVDAFTQGILELVGKGRAYSQLAAAMANV